MRPWESAHGPNISAGGRIPRIAWTCSRTCRANLKETLRSHEWLPDPRPRVKNFRMKSSHDMATPTTSTVIVRIDGMRSIQATPHTVGASSQSTPPISWQSSRFLNLHRLERDRLEGPCDPGNPCLVTTILRAVGFPGSHGPVREHAGQTLRKPYDLMSGCRLPELVHRFEQSGQRRLKKWTQSQRPIPAVPSSREGSAGPGSRRYESRLKRKGASGDVRT